MSNSFYLQEAQGIKKWKESNCRHFAMRYVDKIKFTPTYFPRGAIFNCGSDFLSLNDSICKLLITSFTKIGKTSHFNDKINDGYHLLKSFLIQTHDF